MNEPAVRVTADVALESLVLRCETVAERVDSRWTKRIVCWRPVATRPVDGMSWLIRGEVPPLREVDGALIPAPVTVDGDTYEPILFEPLAVFDAWLDMLQWVTEGDVRAEVRHALEVGTMTEKEWAISHGNSQIRYTVNLEGDALAASNLTSELSIALLYMAQRATRKKGWWVLHNPVTETRARLRPRHGRRSHWVADVPALPRATQHDETSAMPRVRGAGAPWPKPAIRTVPTHTNGCKSLNKTRPSIRSSN